MEFICDNQAMAYITSNITFHEIEVDCYFIQEKVLQNVIKITHMKSEDQLAHLFTKALDRASIFANIYTHTHSLK